MPDKPPTGFLKGKTGGISHKWWLFGGLGVGGVAFLYYKHNAAATVTPTDPNAATDPNATSGYTDPYAGYDSSYGTGVGGSYGTSGGTIDPTTDPAYQALLQQQQGIGDALSSIDTSQQGIDTSLQALAASQVPAETNAEWMKDAITNLQTHGYTEAAATAAVAAYLAGVPMTQKQIHAVETAVGVIGGPPHNALTVHQIPTPKPTKKDTRHPASKTKKATPTSAPKQPAPQPQHATAKPPAKTGPKPAPKPSPKPSKPAPLSVAFGNLRNLLPTAKSTKK